MKGVFEQEKPINVFIDEVIAFAVYNRFLKIFNDKEYCYDEYSALKKSIDFFGLKILPTEKNLIKFDEIHEIYKDAKIFTGLNIDVLIDFQNSNKDLYQTRCLMTFLALKSIIGIASITKTNNNFLFSRIAGFESVKEYQNQLKSLSPYLIRKIKDDLQREWNVKIAQSKGFYFCIGSDWQKFFIEVEKRKRKSKIEFLKKQKETARIQAKTIIDAENS